MRKTLVIGVILLMAVAMPLFAQGPFADVPTDHWAYDAVNELQQAGIVIGYPDGTFGGKRPMSRYEFAVAIARAIPVLEERVKALIPAVPSTDQFATKDQITDLQNQINGIKSSLPDFSKFATQEQFTSLQNLMNEFRDELKNMAVDVEAVKRDLAGLAARVDQVEKELRRVRWTGNINVGAVSTDTQVGLPVDRDNRALQPKGTATGKQINDITFIRDADLKLTAGLNPSVSAIADINFGNYLPSYLGGIINDYIGTIRPTSGTVDQFIPYYTYIQAGLCKGSLTVGRMPMQLTPYTLKLIDVDTYTFNEKLDSGNYPLDGGSFKWNFGSLGLNLFAAKTNQNSLLGIPGVDPTFGLVSQPTGGLYADSPTGASLGAPFYTANDGTALVGGPLGHAAGGLNGTDQMAGVTLNLGTPFKGNLGLSYFQAVGPFAGIGGVPGVSGYDTVDVYGAAFNAAFGCFPVSLNAAQTRTSGEGVARIDDNSTALDGKIGVTLGKLGIDLGYKDIGNNFGAPGFWDKLGRWTNPTNVTGPYAAFSYPIATSLQFVANGEFLSGRRDLAAGYINPVMNDEDDDVWKAEGGLKWGFSAANSVNLGIEYVQWQPSEAGASNTNEKYINIGFGHQFNASTGINVGYQIIDYKPGAGPTPYGVDHYKGGVAVAQFISKF